MVDYSPGETPLHAAVRARFSVFHFVRRLAADRALSGADHDFAVGRVDEREKGVVSAAEGPGRHPYYLFAGIRPDDSPGCQIGLPGEQSGGLHRQIQPLLAVSQSLLCLPAVVNVSGDAEPSGAAVLGMEGRRGANQEPTVLAVAPPDAEFDLEFPSQFAGVSPFRDEPFEVVRMNHVSRPIVILFGRDAAIVQPLLVVKDDGSVGCGHPDDRGNGIGQSAKTLLALS